MVAISAANVSVVLCFADFFNYHVHLRRYNSSFTAPVVLFFADFFSSIMCISAVTTAASLR